MEIIVGGRKTGKTSRLIEMAIEAEKNGELCYIVCHNSEQAYRIHQKSRELGTEISFPITYGEFVTHSYVGKRVSKFFIDNVDLLLRHLTPVPIAAITINEEERQAG